MTSGDPGRALKPSATKWLGWQGFIHSFNKYECAACAGVMMALVGSEGPAGGAQCGLYSESQEDVIRNIARHLAQVGDSMDRSIPPGLVNGLALQLRNTSRSEEDRNRDLATALEQLLQAYPTDMEKEKTMLVLALLLAKKVASHTPSLLRDVFQTTVNFINQNLRAYVRSLARNGMD
ncbi:PREDICTED: BH3-interacting domain death agonist isoform X2 [Mandrillus leucophaeus]|uniref:BH3-interacting domain death agonist isoform X2 n=1 Tax=Mandrillus leucophaeus TaxID=9568 RepID=UPI0005F578D9|nr:PREDICTED: BH3-interacting domain death agonist isoform X2 [Mandrillus leucophaeus]XP_025254185.1 BH3-interacting domain death agonist isoform X3 [Theropithecus gelada]